ncbi:MAG: hypothetical protein B6I31_00410 [Desulfobacteraceae bacterium 4572_19]|nr:MAG: hypothetical protein B6I31_00410 [Desulfobacteraceae bacterium 4572_19]
MLQRKIKVFIIEFFQGLSYKEFGINENFNCIRLGVAQSVSKEYKLPDMLDHVHSQINKKVRYYWL